MGLFNVSFQSNNKRKFYIELICGNIMNRARKYNAWVNYSEKGYDFKRDFSEKPLNKVKSVTQGRVVCNSGQLVFCDSNAVKSICDAILSDKDMARLPNLMQFNDDAVDFSNHWGDGMFAVLSNKGKNLEVYAETYPTYLNAELTRDIIKGAVRETIEGRKYELEGLVGIGGGRMAIVDPTSYRVEKGKEAAQFFELFTVVKVPKGVYTCEFVDKGEEKSKVSLRRNS
jgi:hypothetical protein